MISIDRPKRDDERDRAAWRGLYNAYADFYRVPMPEARLDLVWAWIHDPAHEVEGFVARDDSGAIVGLAHYRPFARPLAGATGLFLDDLFVDPAARGQAIGALLIGAVEQEAGKRGCTVVRWITADDNYRARTLYDRLATRTMWVTYDLVPDAG